MNVEKMQQIVQLFKELKEEGVYGFNFHDKAFHVGHERLINEPNLILESRGSDDYPYEIYVQHDGLKIFAIIKNEHLKDFPQFKERARKELMKQLALLEKEEEATA